MVNLKNKTKTNKPKKKKKRKEKKKKWKPFEYESFGENMNSAIYNKGHHNDTKVLLALFPCFK